MEDLFRLMVLRPPQDADRVASVPLAQASAFQQNLATLRQGGVPGGRLTSDGQHDESQPPPPQGTPRENMIAEARSYQSGRGYPGQFLSDPPTMLTIHRQLTKLREELTANPAGFDRGRLLARIREIFAVAPNDLPQIVSNQIFLEQRRRLIDSIVALFLLPSDFPRLIEALTQLAQTDALLLRAISGDASLDSAASIQAALNASLILPPQIFPILSSSAQIQPVGVADLLVVKQQLKGYELGEVSTIENLMARELRSKSRRHTLTKEQTQVTEQEKTTETTQELNSAERFELKQEVENTLKEELSVKAGVSVSARYGVVNIDAKTDVAFSQAKGQTSKLAKTQAKDVTLRAATKVTERVRTQTTSRILESFKERERRDLNNTEGTRNITGVYQFVNKVYEAQVFNYGKRLLFDLMVPEPAAFLLDAVADAQAQAEPTPPPPFNLSPELISDRVDEANYYGKLAARLGAAGVPNPPLPEIIVDRAFAGQPTSGKDIDEKFDMQVPADYLTNFAEVSGSFIIHEHGDNEHNLTNHSLDIVVGGQRTTINGTKPDDGAIRPLTLTSHRGSVAVGVHGFRVASYMIQVALVCRREPSLFSAWQIKVHEVLQAAHRKLVQDFEEKRAERAFQTRTSPALGTGNPDRNRAIERDELKKACIALLGGVDLLRFDGIDENDKGRRFPRPANVATVQQQGRIIRFFEQAFEWEQITYLFYPYYWARSQTWYDRALKSADDPTFEQFLRAGSARVVVPVRPGFEGDVRYFLLTGELWGGAPLPSLTSPDYLPITEEIKELTGAPEDAVPQEQPWEVKVPTAMIKLRPDGKMPGWKRVSPSTWQWLPTVPDDL